MFADISEFYIQFYKAKPRLIAKFKHKKKYVIIPFNSHTQINQNFA